MANQTQANGTVFRRLFQASRPVHKLIVGIFFLELLATPIALLVPIPIKLVVDSVLADKPVPDFITWVLPQSVLATPSSLLIFAVFMQIGVVLLVHLQDLSTYVLQTYCGERLTLSFREKLFKHAQRLSFMFHDKRGTSDTIYRIQYDSPSIQNIIVYGISSITSALIKLIGMCAVIATINLQLALVALIVAPVLYFFIRFYNRYMKRKYSDYKDLESHALGIVQEVMTGMRVVKAFGSEERERLRFTSHFGNMISKRVSLSCVESLFSLWVNFITACGTALILYIGVINVQSGALSLGELLMVISYLTMLYAPLQTIFQKVADIQSSYVSAQRVFELLDEVPDVVEVPDAESLDNARGQIEFRDVSFTYDGQVNVLDRVSFKLPAGARVGIAGRTGAGKTTLVSLLTRFYDPAQGDILLDGKNIKFLTIQSLRNQFSIVLQEPVLFSSSIRENIAYARHGASEEEIIEAAKAANAHDFIMKLPDQYDTLVGERGMGLSGGERQRISLARSFLKNSPILILDEPTSSVDTETENQIMEAMDRLMANRTTVMIAHRLSTLEKCDIRLEVGGGKVTLLNRLMTDMA